MTINLGLPRRRPLLSHNGPGALKRRRCAVFLIANARLELRPSHRKLSPLKFPNRERMAILHPISEPQRKAASSQLSRRDLRGRSPKQPPSGPLTKPEFLIVTQGLELPLKPVKTISSKFLIVTKRTLIIRPAASHSPQSFPAPNFNPGQRNDLRLKWHRHSCLPRGTKGLCSNDHQPTTSNPQPRPHFTCTSTQPNPRLQSNFREQADAA